jgi:hypothetical protein
MRFFILPTGWIGSIFFLMLDDQAQRALLWIGFAFGYDQPENVVSTMLNVILILSFILIWCMPGAQTDLMGATNKGASLKNQIS